MKSRILACVGGAALFLAGCVPVPPGALPEEEVPPPSQAAFAPLDAGSAQVDSLHFRVHAYGDPNANQISRDAEADYSRIMTDTNLFSFQPAGLYEIVVYATHDEYSKKTGQPDWSGGVCVGNAIYTFMSDRLNETVSHEMTHLIFYEYLGSQGQNPDYRWINEGLAVFEEIKAAQAAGQPSMFASLDASLPRQPIPLDQLVHLVPATEKAYRVSLWYAESESMVEFMIRRGGSLGFYQFLTNLKNGQSPDAAIGGASGGLWANLASVYQSWFGSLP